MNAKPYCLVSAFIFTLVACAHGWRAVQALPMTLGNWQAPVAASWIAVVVAGLLAIWGFRLAGGRA